jgi:hypothetical protein
MAEDFHLPGGGHKRLSLLVAGHMHWFDAAERRGMGWRDMIRALTAAGVNGGGGKPLSVGTLSSTVWRKRAETKDMMSRADRQARLAPPEPIPESQPVRSRKASPKQGGRCPCRKLKLEHIDGVVRPRSVTNARPLFGTHHAEPACPSAAIAAF